MGQKTKGGKVPCCVVLSLIKITMYRKCAKNATELRSKNILQECSPTP
jgi:hypothetical protein